MMQLRSPFVSRSAALGLLAGLLLLAWAAVIQPALSLWTGLRETQGELAVQLNHLTLLTERRPGIEAMLRQREATLSDPTLLWSGGSGPAIAASIQTRLQGVVAAGGGALRSITDLPQSAEHGLSRITLRVDVEGSVQTLQAMLPAIETGNPALFIDDITINAPGANRIDQPPILSVQLDVTGFARSR